MESTAVSKAEANQRDGAFWAARLDRGTLSAADQVELNAWLAADERNQGDLLQARAALVYMVQNVAAAEDVPSEGYRARPRAWLAVAASFALLSVIVGWPLMTNRPDAEIRTSVGELRKVPLADGSIVTINTASMVEVRLKSNERELRLERGEALFEVARDAARPFIVEAGNVNVRAVGTAFSVRRRENGVEIHVVEGSVETWITGSSGARKRVRAGERAFVSLRAADIAVSEDANANLAWREGLLEFNNTPLITAIDEINRYNNLKIILDDPALGQQTLVGSFRSNDPERFASAVREMFDARITKDKGVIRISPATQ